MKTVIIAIIMFLLLVTIHEFGHFIVAKLSGIKVNEFAVGMGPAIYSKEKGETLYSLRILPIGGYCAMEGEDESSSDPRSYDNAPASRRFLTILAGPFMNLLLAAIIFSVVIFNTGTASTKVGGFSENSKAKEAGIEIGDQILKVNDENISEFADISKVLAKFYEENDKDLPVEVLVKRNDEEKSFTIKPYFEKNTAFLGVSSKLRDVGFFESIGLGFKEMNKNVKMIFAILGNLFTGKLSVKALSGPVGVVKEIGNQANNGLMNLLYFLAYISVNLGVFNLIPFPALDGSKLVTNLYEMITKKKVNKKIEEKVTIVGFVILLSLILLVTIKDVFTLF
ncbi:RIP metalloprotease RseP [Anaerococcus sp. Marseille-P3625]|uniref:RIP metalloprotease RseP n=1 Tax=Anaerococcus sp. Marseille-P3625 TaxID=1977277 RepID=UPI000C07F4FD|nr:RIP metalloprotease RseP [Anaerococcus sp. Marseille-P3625]